MMRRLSLLTLLYNVFCICLLLIKMNKCFLYIFIYIYMVVRLLLSLRNNFAFFFSVSYNLLLLLLFLYKSNVNRVHKEKLLLPIAVMYVEVMVDTPRYCDYVYAVWVVVLLSLSLSLLSFLLRIYCSGYVSSAQYGDDAQDLFFTAADTIHSSLFLSVSLLFFTLDFTSSSIFNCTIVCAYIHA